MVGSDGSTTQASGSGVGRLLLIAVPLLVVGGIVLAVVFMREGSSAPPEAIPLDADLCPVAPERIAASATVVLDTGKPIAGAPPPSSVLRDVSLELAANTELRVYALRADANAPLASLARLCKPYHGGDLSVAAAKDQRDANLDCDDLPAQLSPFLRDAAQRFCVRRNQLEARADELVRAARRTVTASHLFAALREAQRELAARREPQALYVYSDMLVHTEAYSHFDLEWTQWRTAQAGASAPEPSAAGMAVTVFYLPREGITEPLRPRRVHQDYWRAFFSGAEVSFADYEPASGYLTLPLMRVAGAREQAEDDQALGEELARIEQLRTRIAEETAALAAQRQESAAVREQLTSDGNEPGNAAADLPQDARQSAAGAEDEATANAANAPPEDSPSAGAATTEQAGAPSPLPESVPLALPVETPPPPDLELTAADALAPCAVELTPASLVLLAPEGYPGGERVNYGAGVVVVDYAVDEDGDTVDADVVLRSELSSSTMPEHFDALAADTLDQVRAWRFDFTTSGNCGRPQRQTATFNYASRCVGAPRPSCRTVRTSVTRR